MLLPELRFCLDLLLDELAHAQEQVRRVTVRLKELAEAERHRKATAVMCSVPGVGVLTAAAFRLELPEPQRFDHEGQVARMAGLAPQVRQSGETRREGGLLKSGNARLRTVLVEAAWRWVRYDEAAARSLPAAGGQHRQRQEGHRGDGAAAGGAPVAAERPRRALPGRCLKAHSFIR